MDITSRMHFFSIFENQGSFLGIWAKQTSHRLTSLRKHFFWPIIVTSSVLYNFFQLKVNFRDFGLILASLLILINSSLSLCLQLLSPVADLTSEKLFLPSTATTTVGLTATHLPSVFLNFLGLINFCFFLTLLFFCFRYFKRDRAGSKFNDLLVIS